MPRNLSTEIKTAIAAGTVRPVYLAYFNFASGAVRTWTGQGDLTYDSQTWSSDGRVLRWPTITESIQLVAHNISIQLSSHATYTAEPTDPAEYRARTCEIYVGFLTSGGSLPAANVYKVFSGRMAELSYDEDTQSNAYSLVVESRLVDLTKAKASRYTHQTQLQRFAGDRGLEYAGAAQDSLFLTRGETPDKPFSRKAIYGTTVVEGSVVFVATSGTGSRYLNLAVAFADHECDAIEQLYLDDRAILSSGVVAGEFVDVVDYYAHFGTPAQTVDTDLQTEVGSTVWTNDHRLRGITYVYLRILYSEELFGGDAPAVTARIRGKKLYDPRVSVSVDPDNFTFDDGINFKYWNVNALPDVSEIVIIINGVVTTTDVGVYIDVNTGFRVFFAERTLLNSSDDVLLIRKTYSTNAALAVRDYLLSKEYGFSSGSAEIDDTSISVAANDCDFLVTRADATTEKRYTINGWLDTAERIGDNLQIMLAAMAGKLSYMGGVFSLYAGSYALTSLTVDDAALVSDIRFSNRNLREAYNGARGVYRTPALDWQEEDYPPYQNATALAADGNEARWIDLPLPLTTSAARCQRIAKIAVMRSRAARQLELAAMLKLLEIRAGDVISLNTSKSNIDVAVYEVRSLSIALELQPRIDLELLEVAAADYTWDAATEETELTVPEEPADSILSWTLARLNAPSATPGSQTFVVGFNVTVSHNESGVTCHYTIDGSDPDEADSTVADGGTIAIGTATTTLKLKTFQNVGSLTSATVTFQYDYEAPTDQSTIPEARWGAVSGSPGVYWYIGGSLNDLTLKASQNSGVDYTTITTNADIGDTFYSGHTVPESWSPANYRAYTSKAAYLDSPVAQVPNNAIPAMGYIENDITAKPHTNYLRLTAWATNGKLYHRLRIRYYSVGSYGAWGSWTDWGVFDYSVSWGETYSFVISHNTSGTSYEYQREFYVEQSGFSNSYITFANGDVFFHSSEFVEVQYP